MDEHGMSQVIVLLTRALHAAAPDRCVRWSGWLNMSHGGSMMNVGEPLDPLDHRVPDPAARHRVLVDDTHWLDGVREAVA